MSCSSGWRCLKNFFSLFEVLTRVGFIFRCLVECLKGFKELGDMKMIVECNLIMKFTADFQSMLDRNWQFVSLTRMKSFITTRQFAEKFLNFSFLTLNSSQFVIQESSTQLFKSIKSFSLSNLTQNSQLDKIIFFSFSLFSFCLELSSQNHLMMMLFCET